jgi:capsular exopolysaccharide synthesis family protein
LTESLAQLRREESVRDRARVRLRELEREVAANRAVYEPFLSRFKETREQQGDQQADARIISQAPVPVDPSFPNMSLNAVLGLVMSGLIGLGAVFLLERLDDGFQTVRQLETDLQLPHLASIPELTKAQAEGDGEAPSPDDYTLAKPLSAYGESLRGLRAKLLMTDAPPKLILFTSALPSEGKTTTTISLGRAAAQAGMRVLVIDADLRNPSVARDLGHRPQAGLVEFLADQEDLADVLFLDEPSGMQVLPVASGTANPPDLLGSAGMRDMLEKLKLDFDLILVDSPPVLAVADAKVLGRVVDSVVFITQWEATPRGAAQEAVRGLSEFGVKVTGVVFTRLDMNRYAKYGYGDYNYHGRYSDYYVN